MDKYSTILTDISVILGQGKKAKLDKMLSSTTDSKPMTISRYSA